MDILAFLVLASIVGLLVGRKRPEWVRMASRKQATWVFGGLVVVFALLFSAFSDVEPTEQAAPVVQAELRTEETAVVPEASTAEDRVLAEGEVQPEETRVAEVAASSADADVGTVEEGAPAVVAPRASAVAQPMTAGGEVFDVESVVDGDTIKVSMNGKVETLRLIGIDTPETKDPRKPVQCFGAEASRKATELLAGQKVRLEADASQGERDKYGRLLRYVWRTDGLFFNDWMIRNGYAFEYTYNTPYQYQAIFKEAQRHASDKNLGLWNPSTCDGEASAVETTKPSVVPVVPAVAEGGGHTFYTSSHSSAKYYYCDTDPGWQSLSTANLRSFSSEADLRNAFSSRTLHEPCK